MRSAGIAGAAMALAYASARDHRFRGWLWPPLFVLAAVDLIGIHGPSVVFDDWEALRRSPVVSATAGDRLFHYCAASPTCPVPEGGGLVPWIGVLRPGEAVRDRARSLWAALVPDAPMIYGLGAVSGNDGFSTRAQELFFQTLAALPRDRAIRLLASLGVGRLVGAERLDGPPAGLAPLRDGPDVWQYAILAVAPRIYAARNVILADDDASALRRIGAADFRPGVDAVVVGPARGVSAGASRAGDVSDVSFTPGGIRATVSLSETALVVVSDTSFPGWTAAIDGVSAPILRVNGLVRGVVTAAGLHTIEMRYAPASFRAGCWISAFSAAVLFGTSLYAVRSSRRASP
jgi:hypothetical protein